MSRPDDLDRDVLDAIGELTNMIAGSEKTKLEQCQMTIGLPMVVCGMAKRSRSPRKRNRSSSRSTSRSDRSACKSGWLNPRRRNQTLLPEGEEFRSFSHRAAEMLGFAPACDMIGTHEPTCRRERPHVRGSDSFGGSDPAIGSSTTTGVLCDCR